MLRTFAAALLATALIAGPALAVQPAGNSGSTAVTTTKSVSHRVHPRKHVVHVKRTRSHVARHKVGTIKQARHVKTTKTHQSRVTKHHKISKSAA
jgi:hypothetical protein